MSILSDQLRPACRRRDHVMAAYVDAALRISQMINVQRAEAILVEQGVPHGVIVRALHLNGLLRRHGGAGV